MLAHPRPFGHVGILGLVIVARLGIGFWCFDGC